MTWLTEIKKASRSNTVAVAIIAAIFLLIPGFLALTLGLQGSGGTGIGIILILLYIGILVYSTRKSSAGNTQEIFLQEVDSIGDRPVVLTAIDAIPRDTRFIIEDVRLHPAFFAFRAGTIAHIWRADSLAWIYIKKQNTTNKSTLVGITIAKSISTNYFLEVCCVNRKSYAFTLKTEQEGQNLIAQLKTQFPHATFGYSPQIEQAYNYDPRQLIR